jgi:ribosomal protein S18 acetylase RimI-like enzyme
MMIQIKTASEEHAELIADLSRRTFHETFAEYNTAENMQLFMERNFSKRLLMNEVGSPRNIFLLAYYNGELAGYARLREDNNPPLLKGEKTLEVARIYAAKEFIGKGIGKALMEAAIDIARKKGKDIVWLGVWEKNQRAIDFYARWGFEKFSDHEFILGNDIQNDWLMKKKIT